MLNFSILLTLLRLISSITILPFLLIWFLPTNSFNINLMLSIFFILLGLTDFFDGFFARKYNQETLLGGLLDPIADKFLLFSTLITLLSVGKIYFYIPIIFISREFFIMGLRQVALTHGFEISVIQSAKFKTLMQFCYLTCVILNNYQSLFIYYLEYLFLFVALFLSMFSALEYFLIFIKKLGNVNEIL